MDKKHQVDFCVVGGGMAGVCAAVAAARHGARVALMHDRPVPGGNASSEIRMWICGAQGENNRETGILEEIHLENDYRNPSSNYSVWDSVLFGLIHADPNITLLLNCSCCGLDREGTRIRRVKGWQTTTQTWHTVEAALFADCSGDSILAPLSGAEFRVGREARGEFGEEGAPAEADRQTMGMSCLIQARETTSPRPFIPPPWARVFPDDAELPYRGHSLKGANNFWWIEVGGDRDSIGDTETLRDELLAIAFGVWDHVKNRGDHGAAHWELDWVGFLPGKRESRRYVGDHILTAQEIRAGGRFDDVVAYGGWPLDDHHPGGMRWPGAPTVYHPAPSPYGIPYRSLYSRNIANLFCAGRNIGATHLALSSTRVMATCGVMGQAIGTAAAIAAKAGIGPRRVGETRLDELQRVLMDDDCYLPWRERAVPRLSRDAALTASEGDPSALRNGIDRPVADATNAWTGANGSWVAYTFAQPTRLSSIRLVCDSDLNRKGQGALAIVTEKNSVASYPLDPPFRAPPSTLLKAFDLDVQDRDGHWRAVRQERLNYQRLVRIPLSVEARAVRLTPQDTWGAESCRLFAFDVE